MYRYWLKIVERQCFTKRFYIFNQVGWRHNCLCNWYPDDSAQRTNLIKSLFLEQIDYIHYDGTSSVTCFVCILLFFNVNFNFVKINKYLPIFHTIYPKLTIKGGTWVLSFILLFYLFVCLSCKHVYCQQSCTLQRHAYGFVWDISSMAPRAPSYADDHTWCMHCCVNVCVMCSGTGKLCVTADLELLCLLFERFAHSWERSCLHKSCNYTDWSAL